MIGPSWLADVLAAVALSVALFSAGRLIASRGRQRQAEVDADGVHVLMGMAMAGMFVPGLATLPNPGWEIIFAGGAAWFAWRSANVRRGSPGASSRFTGAAGSGGRPAYLGFSGQCCEYPVPHLVDCVAMLYTLWAVRVLRPGALPGSGGMGAMAGGAGGVRWPALGLVLALCICGYVVWLGDRIQLLTPAAIAAAAMDSAEVANAPAGSGTFTARLSSRAQLAPRAATCCKIAMGVAMGVMLIDIL